VLLSVTHGLQHCPTMVNTLLSTIATFKYNSSAVRTINLLIMTYKHLQLQNYSSSGILQLGSVGAIIWNMGHICYLVHFNYHRRVDPYIGLTSNLC